MTKLPAVVKGFALAFAMVVAIAGSVAAHARIDVLAVDSEVTESNGLATAKFKVQVSNHEETVMTSVRIVFEGGIEVAMSDVAADATVTTGGQKFMFDITNMPPTRSFPVPVTVKFSINGVESETTAILAMKRAE